MKKVRSLLALLMGLAILMSCACSKTDSSEKKKKESTSQTSAVDDESETTKTTVDASQTTATAEDSQSESTTMEPTPAPEEKVRLSDGPMIMEYKPSYSGFKLYQFSLESGDYKLVFDFDNTFDVETPGSINYLYTNTLDVFNRQVFDANLERLAIYWQVNPDEWHVGWVNKEGVITDITSKLRGESTGFALLPKDKFPLFDPAGRLVFYDENESVFSYYDENTNTIVDTFEVDRDSKYGMDLWYSLNTSKAYSLDFGNRPLGAMMDIETREGVLFYSHGAQDYVEYSDGTVFFEIIDGSIYHAGSGIYDIELGIDDKKFYSDTKDAFEGTDYRKLTPDSDWTIYSLAYGKETIVFTACRQDSYALFKMTYTDRKAGGPEQVVGITNNQQLFFWEDSDDEVRVIG